MTWYTRAPHAGWYVVLTMALCLLAVVWAGFYGFKAIHLVDRATSTLDRLDRGRWVQLDSGDVIIRKRKGQ